MIQTQSISSNTSGILISETLYNGEQNKLLVCFPMMLDKHFPSKHGTHRIAALPTASLGIQTTIETFQMRYCMMLHLKGHQNCHTLKI